LEVEKQKAHEGFAGLVQQTIALEAPRDFTSEVSFDFGRAPLKANLIR
jgi:hypothetical protein